MTTHKGGNTSCQSRARVKINFEGKCLLNTGQFTVKDNIWDHEILAFNGRLHGCLTEVNTNTGLTVQCM